MQIQWFRFYQKDYKMCNVLKDRTSHLEEFWKIGILIISEYPKTSFELQGSNMKSFKKTIFFTCYFSKVLFQWLCQHSRIPYFKKPSTGCICKEMD